MWTMTYPGRNHTWAKMWKMGLSSIYHIGPVHSIFDRFIPEIILTAVAGPEVVGTIPKEFLRYDVWCPFLIERTVISKIGRSCSTPGEVQTLHVVVSIPLYLTSVHTGHFQYHHLFVYTSVPMKLYPSNRCGWLLPNSSRVLRHPTQWIVSSWQIGRARAEYETMERSERSTTIHAMCARPPRIGGSNSLNAKMRWIESSNSIELRAWGQQMKIAWINRPVTGMRDFGMPIMEVGRRMEAKGRIESRCSFFCTGIRNAPDWYNPRSRWGSAHLYKMNYRRGAIIWYAQEWIFSGGAPGYVLPRLWKGLCVLPVNNWDMGDRNYGRYESANDKTVGSRTGWFTDFDWVWREEGCGYVQHDKLHNNRYQQTYRHLPTSSRALYTYIASDNNLHGRVRVEANQTVTWLWRVSWPIKFREARGAGKKSHRYNHPPKNVMRTFLRDAVVKNDKLKSAYDIFYNMCDILTSPGSPRDKNRASVRHVKEAFNAHRQANYVVVNIRGEKVDVLHIVDARTKYGESYNTR